MFRGWMLQLTCQGHRKLAWVGLNFWINYKIISGL